MLWIKSEGRLFSADSITQDGCKLYFCQRGEGGPCPLLTLTCDSAEDAKSEMVRINAELATALEKGKSGVVVEV